ncbi:threonine aldolase family protein [Psychrobacter sp. I-STPA6b]|uniref:threonine aldolase family protein n=1 Tax=Psychrobacter sp. I-STPA6b TaxID=2585718 RepID=UPI001D0C7E30|nr:aminotransferase class I/II-fold pyridoxal phosphate-dependent enzyme [Psychrobacter sp. I-STPA6b]
MTYSFLNDYSESAHPDIITALQDIHLQQHTGYGFDDISEVVKATLRQQLNNNDIAIHFAITGTQTNQVCIASLLSPIDGIIASDIGHIASNEAGAIEATGHKVITAPHTDGKLTVSAIDDVYQRHQFLPHVVRAKAVYLSNSTELGTVYTYDDLKAISDYCRAHQLYLFIDGARLGSALASEENTGSLADIAELADIFWLGGTKMGAMFGEAIIIPNTKLAEDFAVHLKQRGALMAKGYLLALQFKVLLDNDKYLKLCQHANLMATRLSDALLAQGIQLYAPLQSNQVFAILPDSLIQALKTDFAFYEWKKLDNQHSIVRFVTSWATADKQIDKFIATLENLKT